MGFPIFIFILFFYHKLIESVRMKMCGLSELLSETMQWATSVTATISIVKLDIKTPYIHAGGNIFMAGHHTSFALSLTVMVAWA